MEAESLQAQLATAKRAHEAAEQRAGQLVKESSSAKARANEMVATLQAAQDGEKTLQGLAKRLAGLPSPVAEGITVLDKVHFELEADACSPWVMSCTCAAVTPWLHLAIDVD